MSYVNLINSQLTKAFNLVKDLAVVATLQRKTGSDFDFGSATVSHTAIEETPVKVVLMDLKKKSETHNVIKKQVMMKSKDFVDISLYDSLTLSGVVWRFGPVLQSNGYLAVAEVFKEA